MGKSVTNPDFSLGGGSYSAPEQTPSDLLNSLKNNDRVVRLFKSKGYITSNDWEFITHNNFSRIQNSPNPKDTRGKEYANRAQDNLDAVKQYLSENTFNKQVELEFIGRDVYECALFDKTRHSVIWMQEKMSSIFDEE